MQPPPEANAPPGQQPRAVRKDQAVVVEHKATEPTTTVFWVDTSIGWQRVDLTTLHVQRNSAGEALTGDLVPNVLSGPALSLGVGVRWLVLSFGARMTAAFFNDPSPDRTDGSSQFYSLDAEIGLRIPAGRLEPYVVLGAGYSVFGGLDDAIRGVGQGLDIDGANARLALGVDYFFSRNWSLGARVTGELLFLARPGVPIRGLATAEQVNTLGEARARLLEGEGTSGGTALAFTFGPGLHF
jgi:hypothetical protein